MLSMLSLGMVFPFRGSWCHTDEPCSLLAVTDAIINGASSSEIITFYSASLCLLNSITLQSSPNRHVSKPNYYWQSRYVLSFSFPATPGCSSFALGPSQRSSSHVLPSSYVRLSGYQHLLHALFYMRSRCPVLHTQDPTICVCSRWISTRRHFQSRLFR